MNETDRRTAVDAQLKQLLDDAAKPMGCDTSGIVNLGRAMLYAEMYERQQKTNARADKARSEIVGCIQWRASDRKGSK